jgi:colanic acid/amylovoran biosynthesis glycosyltransferase
MTTSAIQALAMGLPCVTTDHSGFREQIIDGKNGYVVPEGDYEAFGEAILKLMDQPEVWRAFGIHGRAYMKAHYDSGVLIDRQIAIYNSLVA